MHRLWLGRCLRPIAQFMSLSIAWVRLTVLYSVLRLKTRGRDGSPAAQISLYLNHHGHCRLAWQRANLGSYDVRPSSLTGWQRNCTNKRTTRHCTDQSLLASLHVPHACFFPRARKTTRMLAAFSVVFVQTCQWLFSVIVLLFDSHEGRCDNVIESTVTRGRPTVEVDRFSK